MVLLTGGLPPRHHEPRAARPLDETNARAALRSACDAAGLPSGAELIRLGENAVFRLVEVPVVARVARDADRVVEVRQQLAVSAWLAGAGLPVVRPWPPPSGADQPIEAAGRLVVFWAAVSDGTRTGTTGQLGGILRRLHALDPPPGLELPAHDPFAWVHRRLATVATLSDDDRAFLQDRARRLEVAYAELAWVLPRGPIHDDASVGNLLADDDGLPVLCDLDGVAIGPREWDLVPTAVFHDRFGWHTRREYDAFVDAYGYDLLTWPRYPTLADVREVFMVSWLSQNAAPGTPEAAELSRRIATLRRGGSRRDWRPR